MALIDTTLAVLLPLIDAAVSNASHKRIALLGLYGSGMNASNAVFASISPLVTALIMPVMAQSTRDDSVFASPSMHANARLLAATSSVDAAAPACAACVSPVRSLFSSMASRPAACGAVCSTRPEVCCARSGSSPTPRLQLTTPISAMIALVEAASRWTIYVCLMCAIILLPPVPVCTSAFA